MNINKELLKALIDLVEMIENDSLIPDEVSYMKQAKKAIADAKSLNSSQSK